MSVIKKLFSKKAFFLLPVVVGGLLLSVNVAHAAGIATIWDLLTFNGGVSGFFAALLYPIVEILARLLALAGILVNYAIQPSDIPLTSSDFVIKGWTAMRDLTNMVFILILLGIALDYILFNSVGVKRSLPRLLIIAILINFSLPIAGIVIDFANVFTVFFMDNAVGGAGTGQLKFSEALANQLHLSSLFTANPDVTVTNVGKILDSTFTGTIFVILMLLGTLFVFIALAAMFFIRYFFLSILLIVLPLALVASVIPPLSSTFGKWTNKFFKWTMFAPAASFFLYLTMIFLSSNQMKVLNNATSAWSVSNTGVQITTYIFAWVLMVMSLTTAQSMGAIGASSAVTMWNKGTKWARGKAGRATTASLAAAGRRLKADEQLESLAKGLRSIPGFGGILESGVRGASIRTKAAIKDREELTAKEKARYEAMSRSQRQREADILKTSRLAGSGAQLAQLQALQAQKGELNVVDPKTGEIDLGKTRIAIKAAYEAARKFRFKDKKTMETIMYANPTIGMEILQENWKRDAEEGKLINIKRGDAKFGDRIIPGAGDIIDAANRETGATFEEKLKEFKYLSSEDMKNAKGTWTAESVASLMRVGGIDASFAKKAADVGDTGVLKHIETYLKQLTDAEKRKEWQAMLKKHNPGAVNDFKSGRMARFGIQIPPEAKILTEKGLNKQNEGVTGDEEI